MNRTGEGRLDCRNSSRSWSSNRLSPVERPDWRHRPRVIHRNCEPPSTRLWVSHLHGDQTSRVEHKGLGDSSVPVGRESGLVPLKHISCSLQFAKHRVDQTRFAGVDLAEDQDAQVLDADQYGLLLLQVGRTRGATIRRSAFRSSPSHCTIQYIVAHTLEQP